MEMREEMMGQDRHRAGMAFLAENPEASGLIPDAVPLSFPYLLVAAGGQSRTATLLREAVLTEGVLQTDGASHEGILSGDMVRLIAYLYGEETVSTEGAQALVSAAFGDAAEQDGHPVARYASVFAELVSSRVFSKHVDMTSYEGIRAELSTSLVEALISLRERLVGLHVITSEDTDACRISFAACRVAERDGGYDVDVFVAGGYRVYLLDENGMAPLWSKMTDSIGIFEGAMLSGRRVRIDRTAPFALIVLSESACALKPAERRAVADEPGMEIRYRMRLEDHILRLLISCTKEDEFSRHAVQFFTGRAVDRVVASGAITAVGAPFEVFRSLCQRRFEQLEAHIALMPNGFDPRKAYDLPELSQIEYDLIHRTFRTEPYLREKTVEVLTRCCLDMLHAVLDKPMLLVESEAEEERKTTEELVRKKAEADIRTAEDEKIAALAAMVWPDMQGCKESDAEDGDSEPHTAVHHAMQDDQAPYAHLHRRLTYKDVYTAYRVHDRENDADRARIEGDRAVIRRLLGDYWITLRPIVCEECDHTVDLREQHVRADRAYESCLRLNCELAKINDSRRVFLRTIENELSDALEILRTYREDFLIGRAGNDTASAWMHLVSRTLPTHMMEMGGKWNEDTDRYRMLRAAYTAEREMLMARDTQPESGIWRETYDLLMNGELPTETWELYRARVAEDPETAAYEALFRTLRTISEHIGELRARITARGAERRMVFDISGNTERQLSCMAAALSENPDWDASVYRLADDGMKYEYHQAVRGWKESRELLDKQRKAFIAYGSMYGAYEKQG